MAVHPIEAVIIDGVDVDKDLTREELRQYPREFGTAAVLRTFDLPNTPNVIIAGKNFSYDSADTTTPDDGVTCIHDAAHRRFKIVPVTILGSTMFIASAVAGTATSLDVTVIGMSSLSASPQFVWVTPNVNITGPAQIAFNGSVSYVPIVRDSGATLAADDMLAGRKYLLAVTSTSAQIWASSATF